MLALLAIVVLIPLLYLPGYLIGLALLGSTQPSDLLERHYERVIIGALLNGWLAFTLAQIGIFSAWLHLLLLTLIALICGAIAARHGDLHLPQLPLGIVARSTFTQAKLRTRLAAHWDVLAFAALGIVFAILVAQPFESVLGARDAGVYANTGFAIAHTGGIVQYDALVAQIGQDKNADDPALRAAAAQAETNFLGVQDHDRFIATRLRAGGFFIYDGELSRGRVIPQFFHLYPAWIGLLASLLGLQGGLFATGLMGFLGVWGVGMLGRRLAGRWVGLLAAVFLALNGVQVWFSRYTTSEVTAQYLTFAGLYAFAVSQRRPTEATTQARSGMLSREAFAALLTGIAFGQLALTRVEFFLLIAPLVGYLCYSWLTRSWTRIHTLLAGSLSLLLLQAALHITLIARDYFFNTLFARLQDQSAIIATLSLPFLTPALRRVFAETPRSVLKNPSRLWIELALLVVFCLVCYLIRRDGRPLRLIERLITRRRVLLLRCSALAIIIVACYGYLIRPQLLSPNALFALPSCISPAQLNQPSGDCLALQGYVGAPISAPMYPNQVAYAISTLPTRLTGNTPPARTSPDMRLNDKIAIYQSNMVRFGWYLSPLGVILGLAGFTLWWYRGMDRSAWLFLVLGLLVSVFFLRQAYGTSEATYIYILRRYVPQVYPAFCLGIAYALVALATPTEDARPRTKDERKPWLFISRLSSFIIALALVAFLVITDRPIYRHVEYAGALAQLATIAERFGPQDVLLFRGGAPSYADARDMPDLVVTPLKYAFGLDALTIKSQEPGNYADQLARYVRHWQSQGRQVYLALSASGAVGLPGFQLEPVGRSALHLEEFEQLQNQKPSNVQAFDLEFALYRLDQAPPAAPEPPAAITVDDYAAQVRGFYHPEQISSTKFAWTDGDALLRLPWARADRPQSLTIQLAGGERPANIGAAQVCLAIRPETRFWVEDPAAVYTSLGCFDLSAAMTNHTLTIDPRALPPSATGTALLRIKSSSWVPAQIDAGLADGRALGVQFGGAAISQSSQ